MKKALLFASLLLLGAGCLSRPSAPTAVKLPPIPPPGEPVLCTADVQQCPDGSYVSRQPPNCEFEPCP